LIRFWNVANGVTLLGLASALACALLAAHGCVPYATVALIAAGLCDFFDGWVARKLSRTDEEKRFGAHLDSAVDACSFALAPPLLLHAAGLRSPPELALLAFFATCAVWRLAYFDTVGLVQEGEQRSYTGVPTTFAALVLPLAFTAGFVGPRAPDRRQRRRARARGRHGEPVQGEEARRRLLRDLRAPRGRGRLGVRALPGEVRGPLSYARRVLPGLAQLTRTLIFPGCPAPMPAAEPLARAYPGVEPIRYRTTDGLELVGALATARQPGAPALVYFHGNAESAAQNEPLAHELALRGVTTLVAEYRGYGGLAG
jgi:CDP-diacylglycerol--serine O-phosphatidyltransferase